MQFISDQCQWFFIKASCFTQCYCYCYWKVKNRKAGNNWKINIFTNNRPVLQEVDFSTVILSFPLKSKEEMLLKNSLCNGCVVLWDQSRWHLINKIHTDSMNYVKWCTFTQEFQHFWMLHVISRYSLLFCNCLNVDSCFLPLWHQLMVCNISFSWKCVSCKFNLNMLKDDFEIESVFVCLLFPIRILLTCEGRQVAWQ